MDGERRLPEEAGILKVAVDEGGLHKDALPMKNCSMRRRRQLCVKGDRRQHLSHLKKKIRMPLRCCGF